MAEPKKSFVEQELERVLAYEADRAAAEMMKEAQQHGDRVRVECQSLIGFIEHAWQILEPGTPLVLGWAIRSVANHLEAVTDGSITRLLIAIPPGMMKSLMVSVFWPAWEWGPKGLDYMRYVATSHGDDLTDRDSNKFLKLVESPWFQELWPQVELTSRAAGKVENANMGVRRGASFKSLMGHRGNRLIIDDAMTLAQAESDTEREKIVRLFKEGASSRLNDQKRDAIVIIAQRLHEGDILGYVIANDPTYVCLILPQEFEPERKCVTFVKKDGELRKFFEDPRKKDGELLFPERFDRAYVDKEKSPKHGIGPYAFAGQHQQSPNPRGGGLFKREWLKERMVRTIAELPAPIIRVVRAWDLAATTLKALQVTGARTAGVKIALMRNREYVILHAAARGLGPARVKTFIKETAAADGVGVEISAPQDPGQAGKVQKMDFIKGLAGYNITVTTESGGDKATRFTPFSVQCEFGNVWCLEGEWNEEFFNELETFPNGVRKDLGDACSRGFAHLLVKREADPMHGLACPIVLELETVDEE